MLSFSDVAFSVEFLSLLSFDVLFSVVATSFDSSLSFLVLLSDSLDLSSFVAAVSFDWSFSFVALSLSLSLSLFSVCSVLLSAVLLFLSLWSLLRYMPIKIARAAKISNKAMSGSKIPIKPRFFLPLCAWKPSLSSYSRCLSSS